MPQDPWKVDQIQIEPGAAGTRLINRASDGSIQFSDALITGGITLSQLAGLKGMTNVLVVGKGGAGSGYTTIQAALDAVPSSASAANPYFVFVGPGVYTETVNIVRDGVYVFGYGAILESLAEATPDGAGAYHTLVIQAALGTIPTSVTIVGLTIRNSHSNYACVRIAGGAGSTVGSVGIVLRDCPMVASGSGRTLSADSVDYVWLTGGSQFGSNANALLYVKNLAGFYMDGMGDVPNVELDYDTTGNVPSVPTSSYRVNGCPNFGRGTLGIPVSSTLSGAGSLEIIGSTSTGAASFSGTQAVTARSSRLGAVTTVGTVALSLPGTSTGTITAGVGTTVAQNLLRGMAAFSGTATMAVTFLAVQPDAGYSVSVETAVLPASGDVWWITSKTVSGFTINFAHAQTLNAFWTVSRYV